MAGGGDPSDREWSLTTFPPTLSVSIVTYAPDFVVLEKCVRDLKQASKVATKMGLLGQCRLTLVDNGPGEQFAPRLRMLLEASWNDPESESEYIRSPTNVGGLRKSAFRSDITKATTIAPSWKMTNPTSQPLREKTWG